MSGNSVDNRVVEMTFNNSEFERKMADTMKSLDGLKKSLDFSASQKHIQDLSASTGKFNLHGMAQGIENVSAKFLSLATIAVTTLATITSKAIESGTRIAKAFTIQPILDGFKEYETNINSIQTILANTSSKGTTLTDVTAALDLLNQYSDQTIYNFGQMTRNIGTFTAAGIDLDTSVSAIKGIANLAAISGSNSEQASSAMYQLSQALATGTVKLIDWNSVVNAGMGGEVFQKALFETGKAMGTLADVPLGMSFDQWKDAGNSFRGSLEDGWLTADVLTNTLQAFTGDLNQAQLMALGYTEQQAKELEQLGKTGKAAATDVKTLTQLLSTVREAAGSGWSQSFRIIVGDFEQAKELFTGLSNTIGGFVQGNAEARNKVLQDWADYGGRTKLIDGIRLAFTALTRPLKAIGEAFREVFPRKTGADLFWLTDKFQEFARALIPTQYTLKRLKEIFIGVFNVARIGWEIIKEGAKAFKELFSSATEGTGSSILDFFVGLADKVNALKYALVDRKGIALFFEDLVEAIKHPMEFLKGLKDAIVDFFSGKGVDVGPITAPFDRLTERFQGLKNLGSRLKDIWGSFTDFISPLTDILDRTFEAIQTWFSELGGKMADGVSEDDFQGLWDAINTILLGGIAAVLIKFFKDGFPIDIGGGDLIKKIGGIFDELTGTMKAMQTEIKADALLKIAGAIAILTGSVLVLSTIDSAALAKALAAMAVGFGQLIGSMQLLNSASTGVTGGATLTIIAGGMIAMATALLILSGAMKILGTMDLDDLAKGVFATTVLLGGMVAATRLMGDHAVDMLAGSVAMVAMATALNILALAVLQFSNMSWEEMAQGLIGVGGGLLAMAGGLNLMPNKLRMVSAGIGLIAVAVALNILALALKSIAEMSWEEMAQGLVGVGIGLLLIADAMNLMPLNLPITAAGLILVGVALNIIALAMKSFADMSWGEIAKGLVGIAGSLLILAGAVALMSNAVPGAISIGIIAGALTLLVGVVKQYSAIKWQDLLYGLGGLAATLAVLGLAALALSPVLVPMIALGVALTAIGVGFIAIGAGAALIAKAFQIIAKAGKAGAEVVIFFIDALVTRIPEIAGALAQGLIEFATTILEAGPALVEAFGILLGHILETIIEQAPTFFEAITVLIEGILQTIRDLAPDFIETGLALLTDLLTGMRDNIEEVTVLVAEILVGFLDALAEQLPGIVESVVNLFVTFMLSVAYELGVAAPTLFIGIGREFIQGMIDGINEMIPGLKSWFFGLPADILYWIGDVTMLLWNKGIGLIAGFFKKIGEKAREVQDWFEGLKDKVLDWIGDTKDWLWQKGKDLIQGFINGITISGPKLKTTVQNIVAAVTKPINIGFGIDSPSKVMRQVGIYVMEGLALGLGETSSVLHAVDKSSTQVTKALTTAFNEVPAGLSNLDFQPTIRPVMDLTDIYAKSGEINSMFVDPRLVPTTSLSSANHISAETNEAANEALVPGETPETVVKFEQTINSPSPLNVATIYRNTRNQIELAKKELVIA